MEIQTKICLCKLKTGEKFVSTVLIPTPNTTEEAQTAISSGIFSLVYLFVPIVLDEKPIEWSEESEDRYFILQTEDFMFVQEVSEKWKLKYCQALDELKYDPPKIKSMLDEFVDVIAIKEEPQEKEFKIPKNSLLH